MSIGRTANKLDRLTADKTKFHSKTDQAIKLGF